MYFVCISIISEFIVYYLSEMVVLEHFVLKYSPKKPIRFLKGKKISGHIAKVIYNEDDKIVIKKVKCFCSKGQSHYCTKDEVKSIPEY